MSAWERIYRSPVGRAMARRAGLGDPPLLRRGDTWPAGPIVLAPLGRSRLGKDALTALGLAFESPVIDEPLASAQPPDHAPRYAAPIGAIVVDALDATTLDALEAVRAVLRPAARALAPSGRVVLLARAHDGDWEQHATAQALDGINRTVAKELRRGATSQLLLIEPGTTATDLTSTLAFCLQGRSAFVDGQTWRVGPAPAAASATASRTTPASAPTASPLAGRLVVVTGAARGIGAQIARTAAHRGATVLCVDVPAAGEQLAAVANEVGGTALQLDITSSEAGTAIAAAAARHGQAIYGIVHNAGITRDKLLVNTDAARWEAVLKVNLQAQMAINTVLLKRSIKGGIAPGGRIVGVASTSGIAGNKGQTNYAASKAGVVGLIRAMAPDLADRGITVNAVAPGFIETEMTAAIPFVQREIFQRTNSLSQGGTPVDVAETICYLLDPGSAGVTGQVIRVCGQNVIGA